MRKLVWVLALVGLMFAAANGAGAGSDVGQSILEMRYAQMECGANFMYSAMDSAEDEGADLSEDRAALEAVMLQLRAHVDAGDAGAYNHYMSQLRNTFTVAVRNTKQAQMGALNAAGSCGGDGAGRQGDQGPGAGSGDQAQDCTQERTQMRDRMMAQHGGAHDVYVACKHAAVVGRVQAELAEARGWGARGEDIADSMENRGYDVSGMRETLAEAEEAADELEAEADEAADTNALLEKRNEKWGHIFYLWAQFHAERINLLLDRFVEKTGGYEGQVAEIRARLDEATGLGDDEVYSVEETQQSKQLVNQAMEDFSTLVDEARGSE